MLVQKQNQFSDLGAIEKLNHQIQTNHNNHHGFCTFLQIQMNLALVNFLWKVTVHRGQNSKQINIVKYISKFLICGAKMLDKCVKSQKKNFVHCPFLQSQAK